MNLPSTAFVLFVLIFVLSSIPRREALQCLLKSGQHNQRNITARIGGLQVIIILEISLGLSI